MSGFIDEKTKGMLADATLKEKPIEQVVTESKNPAELPVDPNYIEPTPLAKFREIADALSRDADVDPNVSHQRGLLIQYLINRQQVLEDALMPFCVAGMMVINAAMNLAALGRASEPAGGTWLSNPPEGIQLQPNQSFFFNAIDAVGRGRTDEHMSNIFKRVQEANALQEAKLKHVEAGGSVQ